MRLGEALSAELRVAIVVMMYAGDEVSPRTVADYLGRRLNLVVRQLLYLSHLHVIAPAGMGPPVRTGVEPPVLERRWRITPEFKNVIEAVDDYRALGRALSHALRVDVLTTLIEDGDASTETLADRLGTRRNLVSRHLRYLSELHMIVPADLSESAGEGESLDAAWTLSRKGLRVMVSLADYLALVARLAEQNGSGNGRALRPPPRDDGLR